MRLLPFLVLFYFSIGSVNAEETLADTTNFDVLEFQVEGNSVLGKEKIEESVYPFLGERKTVADVEAARAALEKSFHDSGYLTVFVNIPEQDVGKGIVVLQVQEGKVGRLRVLGSRYYSLGAIKERVPEFAEGSVPYFPAVQKQLASVNGTPDRQVAPVLRPGKTPGTVEVDLKVQDKLPLHGNLELNNRYSPNTTETRLNGSLRYANLWQLDHSIGVSFQVSPEDTNEVKVFSGTYVIPTAGGNYFAAYGVVSDSNVGLSFAQLGTFNVLGKANIYGLRYINPLPAVGSYSHSFTAGVDYKDYKDDNTLPGDNRSPIRYMPFLLGYDSTLVTASSTTQLGINFNFSIRGLGNRSEEFANKRFLAQPDFAYIRTSLKHTQNLYQDWKLVGRVAGQVSNDPLIPNEQFFVGGVDSVRGYYESNSLGDKGVYGSLELRTPSLAKYLNKSINELYAFGFYDTGHVRLMEPLPSQTASFTLQSAGIGFALKGWNGIFAGVDYAVALHDAGITKKGDERVHFRVGYDL